MTNRLNIRLGIPAIAVFPHIDAAKKDRVGSEATNPHGVVCEAVRAMKSAAPGVGLMVDVAIIFIDEIDTIGRARGGARAFGGHDEREQTLNQILTEMDGFSGHEGVVVG